MRRLFLRALPLPSLARARHLTRPRGERRGGAHGREQRRRIVLAHQRFADQGANVVATTSKETQTQLAAEMDRWASVAQALGMKPQ